MNELVQRLSERTQEVEASLNPNPSAAALKERIDLGFIHIKFTETQGGTVLGVKLDPAAVDLSRADFNTSSGTVRLEGSLTLNYEKVRCQAEIDLATLKGTGILVPLN
jgi:hypothetical protein